MIQLNQSMAYEAFMDRAFYLDRRMRKPKNQEYLNLVRAEKDADLKEIKKTLTYLKQRLQNAIEIFERYEMDSSDKAGLIGLLPLIEGAINSDDIFIIVNTGLKLTLKYRGN